MRKLLAPVVLLAAALFAATPGRADKLDRFIGSYVGTAVAERIGDGADGVEQRDLDVTIARFQQTGFSIRWITVVLGPSGQRAGPDVRRRAVDEDFTPSADLPGVFVLAPKGGLFSRSELSNPLKGEPMRWATIKGDVMSVYSIAILPNDEAEMQIYYRTLTPEGNLKSEFVRTENDRPKVRITGQLTRAK
ncbi:MAG: hypothetical protein EXQ88_04465 [Alphaproteobacteria bacterium]|nr:hypothetical protein [Alphaproteobacteria bacterium]